MAKRGARIFPNLLRAFRIYGDREEIAFPLGGQIVPVIDADDYDPPTLFGYTSDDLLVPAAGQHTLHVLTPTEPGSSLDLVYHITGAPQQIGVSVLHRDSALAGIGLIADAPQVSTTLNVPVATLERGTILTANRPPFIQLMTTALVAFQAPRGFRFRCAYPYRLCFTGVTAATGSLFTFLWKETARPDAAA